MADDETTTGDDETTQAAKPRTRRRRKPPALSSSRIEKRSEKVGQTITELVRWSRRDRPGDDDDGFLDTLEQDAKDVGHAVALVGERFKPAGRAMDFLLGEGGPLSILVALSSTIRAARRSLQRKAAERAERKDAEQQAAAEPQVFYDEAGAPFQVGDPEAAEII